MREKLIGFVDFIRVNIIYKMLVIYYILLINLQFEKNYC